jgi:hypothetical protein
MGTSQRRAHPSRAVRALMCVALHWKSMRERLGNGDFEPPRRQDDHHRRESRTSLASGHAAVTPLPSPHPAAVWANATQDRRLRSIVDCDVDGGAAPVPTSNRQLVSVVPSGGVRLMALTPSQVRHAGVVALSCGHAAGTILAVS